MSYFAKIDENNKVLNILVVADDVADGQDFLANQCGLGGTWIETSKTGVIRKQFAIIGGTYDPDADVFISPQPFPSWVLDSNYDWQAPVEQPSEMYFWNEATQQWEV